MALAFAYRDCGQGAGSPAPAQLYVLTFGGESLALGRGRDPAWAPRGDVLAYVADETPPTLRLRDLAANTELTLGGGERPAWQPIPAR